MDIIPPSRGEVIRRWQSWRKATFETEEEVQMGVLLNHATNRSVVSAIVESSRVKRVLAKEMNMCNIEYRAFNPMLALERHAAAAERNLAMQTRNEVMASISDANLATELMKKKKKNTTLPLTLLCDVVIPPVPEGEEHDFTGRTFACLADLPLYTKILIYQYLPIYPTKMIDDLQWLRRAVGVNDGAALRGSNVKEVLGELEMLKTALQSTHASQFGLFAVYYHCIVNTSRTTAPKDISRIDDEHYALPREERERLPALSPTSPSSEKEEGFDGIEEPTTATQRALTGSAAALTLTAGAVAGVRGLLRTHLYFRCVSDQELPDLYPEHKTQVGSPYDASVEEEVATDQYTEDGLLYIAQQVRETKHKADEQIRRRAYLANDGQVTSGGAYKPPFRHTQQQQIHEDLKWCYSEIKLLSDRYALYGHWVRFREQVWETPCFLLRPVLHSALEVWEATLEVWSRRRTDVLGKAAQQEWSTLSRRLPAIYYLGDPERTNEDAKNVFREVGLKFPDSATLNHNEHCSAASDLEALLRERQLRYTKERALDDVYLYEKHGVVTTTELESRQLRPSDGGPVLQVCGGGGESTTITTTTDDTTTCQQPITEDEQREKDAVAKSPNNRALSVETTSNVGPDHIVTALLDDVDNVDRYGLAGIVSGSAFRAAEEISRTHPAPLLGGTGITAKYVRTLTLSQCATLGLLDVPWVRGYAWEVRSHGKSPATTEKKSKGASPLHPSVTSASLTPNRQNQQQQQHSQHYPTHNVSNISTEMVGSDHPQQRDGRTAAVTNSDPNAPITPRTALRMLREDNWVADTLEEVKHTTKGSAHRLLDGHHYGTPPAVLRREIRHSCVSNSHNNDSVGREGEDDDDGVDLSAAGSSNTNIGDFDLDHDNNNHGKIALPLDWEERKLHPQGWIDASVVQAPSSPPTATRGANHDTSSSVGGGEEGGAGVGGGDEVLCLHMPPRNEEREKEAKEQRQLDRETRERELQEHADAAKRAVEDERKLAWLVAAEGMSQRIWRPSLRFKPRQDHHFGGCEMCSKTPVHYVGLARTNSGANQHIVVCRACYDECYSVILKDDIMFSMMNESPFAIELTPRVVSQRMEGMLLSSPRAIKGGVDLAGSSSQFLSTIGGASSKSAKRDTCARTQSDLSAATTSLPYARSHAVYKAIATARAIEAYVESADEPEADRPNISHIDLTLTPNARRVANSMYKWFLIGDLVSKE